MAVPDEFLNWKGDANPALSRDTLVGRITKCVEWMQKQDQDLEQLKGESGRIIQSAFSWRSNYRALWENMKEVLETGQAKNLLDKLIEDG